MNLQHRPKEIDYIIDAIRNEDKPVLFPLQGVSNMAAVHVTDWFSGEDCPSNNITVELEQRSKWALSVHSAHSTCLGRPGGEAKSEAAIKSLGRPGGGAKIRSRN